MILYNPRAWFALIFEFHRSDTFRKMIWVLLAFSVYALALTWVELHYREYFNFHSTIAVHSLLGFIMGLLLVFRTNSAYDRWWEGRKIWGALVNVSRGLAHQLDAQLVHTAPERRAGYAEHLAEFPVLLKEHLRKPRDYAGDHEPNRLLTMLHRDVQ